MKGVFRDSDLSQANQFISSSTSNSSSNTSNHSSLFFGILKQCKKITCQSRCTLLSKAGIYVKVGPKVFCKISKGIKSKSYATNSIIESVLNIGYHKQQRLALNDDLAYPKLISKAAGCGYFWK